VASTVSKSTCTSISLCTLHNRSSIDAFPFLSATELPAVAKYAIRLLQRFFFFYSTCTITAQFTIGYTDLPWQARGLFTELSTILACPIPNQQMWLQQIISARRRAQANALQRLTKDAPIYGQERRGFTSMASSILKYFILLHVVSYHYQGITAMNQVGDIV
jgi:hypothetical protein